MAFHERYTINYKVRFDTCLEMPLRRGRKWQVADENYAVRNFTILHFTNNNECEHSSRLACNTGCAVLTFRRIAVPSSPGSSLVSNNKGTLNLRNAWNCTQRHGVTSLKTCTFNITRMVWMLHRYSNSEPVFSFRSTLALDIGITENFRLRQSSKVNTSNNALGPRWCQDLSLFAPGSVAYSKKNLCTYMFTLHHITCSKCTKVTQSHIIWLRELFPYKSYLTNQLRKQLHGAGYFWKR